MIEITLPDGSKRPFDHPVTVQDVAASIGAGLAKATLAGKVDGQLVDAGFSIDHDASLQIVTDKSPEALEILRHSTAHLLAQAVQRLYPGAQVTIGPVIDNGFYYDFAYERPFTPDDLVKIEAEMEKIVKANPFTDQPANRVQAFFLNDPPPKDLLSTGRNTADDERIETGPREVFVAYGERGIGRSRIRIPAAEMGTARNMNTVAKLAALAREMS